jgi:hypothetical protein
MTQLAPEVVKRLKKIYGYTDEQIAQFSAKQRKLIPIEYYRYRMIAEVVKAETCSAGCAPGLKYVFGAGGVLLPKESTIPWYCVWAIAPMLPFFQICYDRLAAGLDMAFEYVWCPDTGVEYGGFGRVLFKIRWERAPI